VHRDRPRYHGRAGIDVGDHPGGAGRGQHRRAGRLRQLLPKAVSPRRALGPNGDTGTVWLRNSAEGAEDADEVSASPRTKHAGPAAALHPRGGVQESIERGRFRNRYVPVSKHKQLVGGQVRTCRER